MSNPLRKGNVTAEKRNIDKNENSRNLFYRFRLFLFSERVSQKIKAFWISKRSDWQKNRFYTFVEPRKGLGNEACPKCNPQSELTSDEENSTFQGIFMPMECAVYTYSNLVKILILTKGVDFFDTLAFWISKRSFCCVKK